LGVQQRLAIREVSAGRRTMADADLARQLARRQLLRAALAERAPSLLEQRRAQVAVYIVAHDYFLEHNQHP
jgi:hypothetical protein